MRFSLLFAVLPAWLWAQAPPPPTQYHPDAESAATTSAMVTISTQDRAATKLRINPGENATVDLTLTPFPKD